jgi:hypothetical protein
MTERNIFYRLIPTKKPARPKALRVRDVILAILIFTYAISFPLYPPCSLIPAYYVI